MCNSNYSVIRPRQDEQPFLSDPEVIVCFFFVKHEGHTHEMYMYGYDHEVMVNNTRDHRNLRYLWCHAVKKSREKAPYVFREQGRGCVYIISSIKWHRPKSGFKLRTCESLTLKPVNIVMKIRINSEKPERLVRRALTAVVFLRLIILGFDNGFGFSRGHM